MLPRVLIIYTGGTFGMDMSSPGETLSIPKLSKEKLGRLLQRRVPELKDLARCDIEILLNRDSAHIGPDEWLLFAQQIQAHWKDYDGVVLLHGTDTLAYTASALSFLLRPCLKPVVITGAQKPLASIRTDARRNLISAVEIAARGPRSLISQVTVFFDDRLLQGNRARKRSATDFLAFDSPKARPLARVGTQINYEPSDPGNHSSFSRRKLIPSFNRRIALVHLTPGFPAEAVETGLLPQLDGVVLVIFPSGTATTHQPEFIRFLKGAKKRNIPVVTVTDDAGRGSHSGPLAYAAGKELVSTGCHWAGRMTLESAYVKMSYILAQKEGARAFEEYWKLNLAGEVALD